MQQTLQTLLAAGKMQQVIDQLRSLTLSDKDLQQHIALLATRYAKNERHRHAGTLSQSELDLEDNKINAALLAVIERLPINQSQQKVVPTAPKSKWLKIGSAIVVSIGVLAGLAEFSGYSLRDFFEKEAAEPTVVQPIIEPKQTETPPSTKSPTEEVIEEKPNVSTEETETVAKQKSPAAPRNHFEAKDESKQVNLPDNQGTITINQ